MADEVFTTGNANVQAFNAATQHAKSRGDAAEAQRVAAEAYVATIPGQLTTMTTPAIKAAQDAANLATQRANIAGSVANDAALAGKPAGDYRIGREIVTWSGTAITGRTVELASAAEAATSRNAIGNTTLATLGTRTQADGPQFVDGSRWAWQPSGIANGATRVAAAGGGVWQREYSGEISAAWFGADPSGTQDSAAAIQAAMDFAALLGGTVFLPPGTYRVGGAVIPGPGGYLTNYLLRPRNGVTLRGAGPGTVIRLCDGLLSQADDAQHAHFFQPAGANEYLRNFTLRDLVIDGNGANNLNPAGKIRTCMAMRVPYGENVTVENVTVRNLAGHNAFSFGDGGRRARFINVQVINGGPWVGAENPHNHDWSAFYSVWDDTTWDGCAVVNENLDVTLRQYAGGIENHGDGGKVVGCTLVGCDPAIYVSDSPGIACSGQVIQGNTIRKSLRGVVWVITSPHRTPLVQGNDIELYRPVGSARPVVGIEYTGGGATTNPVAFTPTNGNGHPLRGARILDNTIRSTRPADDQSTGMALHSLHDAVIAGNALSELGAQGIVMQGSPWGDINVAIRHNRIVNVCQSPQPNIITRSAICVNCGGSAATPAAKFFLDGLTIEDNHIENRLNTVYDVAGNVTGMSSRGDLYHAVAFFDLTAGSAVRGVRVRRNTLRGLRTPIYPRLDLETIHPELHYEARQLTPMAQPATREILHGGELIEYPDGTRWRCTVLGALGWPHAGITADVTAGSTQAVFLGGNRIHLRPGMLVNIAGAGAEGGVLYTAIRSVLNWNQFTLEDSAGSTVSGATVTVTPAALSQVLPPQPAPADLTAPPTAADYNTLLARLKSAGVLT